LGHQLQPRPLPPQCDRQRGGLVVVRVEEAGRQRRAPLERVWGTQPAEPASPFPIARSRSGRAPAPASRRAVGGKGDGQPDRSALRRPDAGRSGALRSTADGSDGTRTRGLRRDRARLSSTKSLQTRGLGAVAVTSPSPFYRPQPAAVSRRRGGAASSRASIALSEGHITAAILMSRTDGLTSRRPKSASTPARGRRIRRARLDAIRPSRAHKRAVVVLVISCPPARRPWPIQESGSERDHHSLSPSRLPRAQETLASGGRRGRQLAAAPARVWVERPLRSRSAPAPRKPAPRVKASAAAPPSCERRPIGERLDGVRRRLLRARRAPCSCSGSTAGIQKPHTGRLVVRMLHAPGRRQPAEWSRRPSQSSAQNNARCRPTETRGKKNSAS
jgi:hypothetical protein